MAWTYLDQFGPIWTYLDLFLPIWTYLNLFGPTESRKKVYPFAANLVNIKYKDFTYLSHTIR